MIKGLAENADYLVQVSAQVMTRDDSTGGWVPMGGGGLSKVRLCKLSPLEGSGCCADSSNAGDRPQISTDSYRKPEYIIHGERVADNAVILDCRLKKDIQYTKANPKWHHWKTDEKRYGLTFERSEDAKAFDQGIRIAVADLIGGIGDGSDPADTQEGIFSYMPLSLVRKDSLSRSASTTSTTTSSPGTNSPQSPNNDPFNFANPHNHLHRVHYISSQYIPQCNIHANIGQQQRLHRPPQSPQQQSQYQPESPISQKRSSFDSISGQYEGWVRTSLHPSSLSDKSEQGLIVSDSTERQHRELYKEESYVVFNKSKVGALHEYSYPNLEPSQRPHAPRSSTKVESSGSPPSHTSQPYPPLPIKNKSKIKSSSTGGGDAGKQVHAGARCRLVSPQVQCKHCREVFSLDDNPRGSCEDAPDSVEHCIECVSCVSCTQCLMYHCWADADGEFHHPCSCDSGDTKLCKKWTTLTFLSLLLPCLWCYLPLKACHRCGIMCHLCGGRHKAA